ncbi:hypothetical protein KKE34_04655 [Patescibacteria group bacterium]|nr:hypothetical protein [Patescibacteria group bacterium]MBU1885866.1 hypothetical protein [Patescibacteria group bacterium]
MVSEEGILQYFQKIKPPVQKVATPDSQGIATGETLSPQQKTALDNAARAKLSLKFIEPRSLLADPNNPDEHEEQRQTQEKLINAAKQLGLTPEQISSQEKALIFQAAEQAYVQLVELREKTPNFQLATTSDEDQKEKDLLKDIVKLAKQMGFEESDIKARGEQTQRMEYEKDRNARITQAKAAYHRLREIYKKTGNMAVKAPTGANEEEHKKLIEEGFQLKDTIRDLTRLEHWKIQPTHIDPSLTDNKWPNWV